VGDIEAVPRGVYCDVVVTAAAWNVEGGNDMAGVCGLRMEAKAGGPGKQAKDQFFHGGYKVGFNSVDFMEVFVGYLAGRGGLYGIFGV